MGWRRGLNKDVIQVFGLDTWVGLQYRRSQTWEPGGSVLDVMADGLLDVHTWNFGGKSATQLVWVLWGREFAEAGGPSLTGANDRHFLVLCLHLGASSRWTESLFNISSDLVVMSSLSEYFGYKNTFVDLMWTIWSDALSWGDFLLSSLSPPAFTCSFTPYFLTSKRE